MFKKVALVAALAAIGTSAQATTLGSADILFQGWTAGSGFYGYSFTSFTNIAAGTEIYFTDMSWKGTSSNFGWSNSNNVEGLYKWTVGSDVTAGQSLYAALYTAKTAANYVATGVYSSLPTIDTANTCTTAGCKVSGGTTNGSFSILNNTTATAGGTFGYNGSTSYTAIGTNDTFYIYQGGTQTGTTTGGSSFTIPSIGTLITAASDGTGSGDNVVGGTVVAGTQYGSLGTTSNSFATAADAKKWGFYSGAMSFTGSAKSVDLGSFATQAEADAAVAAATAAATAASKAEAVAAAKAAYLNNANWTAEATASPGTYAGLTTVPATFAQNIQLAAGEVTVSYTVAAVPEPSTYAMLLAGLGMMGVIARRRTRA